MDLPCATIYSRDLGVYFLAEAAADLNLKPEKGENQ